MSKLWKLALVGVAALGLGACGDTLGEQALIGAGAGGATAIALGGNTTMGVLAGSAANVIYCREISSKC